MFTIKTDAMLKIGVLIALEQELDTAALRQVGVSAVGVVGVGKVNAAIGAMAFLQKHPEIDLVINMGTAGAVISAKMSTIDSREIPAAYFTIALGQVAP